MLGKSQWVIYVGKKVDIKSKSKKKKKKMKRGVYIYIYFLNNLYISYFHSGDSSS